MARLKVISMLVTIFTIVSATVLISNEVLARELQDNHDYDVDYVYGDDYGLPRSPISDDKYGGDGSYGPSSSPLSDGYGPSGSPLSDDYGPSGSPLSDDDYDDDDEYGPSRSPVSDDDYDDDDDYGPSGSPLSDDEMFVSPAGEPLPAYLNFPDAPPIPDQCQTTQISESCGNTLRRLMLSKTLPATKDASCCLEVIQGTKYCWDAVIKTFESLNQEGYTNLHPWADNTWNTCLKLTLIIN